jgi:hypothetical protein
MSISSDFLTRRLEGTCNKLYMDNFFSSPDKVHKNTSMNRVSRDSTVWNTTGKIKIPDKQN